VAWLVRQTAYKQPLGTAGGRGRASHGLQAGFCGAVSVAVSFFRDIAGSRVGGVRRVVTRCGMGGRAGRHGKLAKRCLFVSLGNIGRGGRGGRGEGYFERRASSSACRAWAIVRMKRWRGDAKGKREGKRDLEKPTTQAHYLLPPHLRIYCSHPDTRSTRGENTENTPQRGSRRGMRCTQKKRSPYEESTLHFRSE